MLWVHGQVSQITSLFLFAVGAIVLVLGRRIMRRFPVERRVTLKLGKIASIQGYLLPGGIVAIIASFFWMIAFARVFPDSPAGVTFLFLPSVILLVFGVGAVTFRVYIWFLGE
jgi:hypothetical protein